MDAAKGSIGRGVSSARKGRQPTLIEETYSKSGKRPVVLVSVRSYIY